MTTAALKHATVTILLFGLLIFIPFFSLAKANAVLLTAMTLSAWLVGDRGRSIAIIIVSIGGAAIVLALLEQIWSGFIPLLLHQRAGWIISFVMLLLLLYCACVIVLSLLKATDASMDEVAGAVNVYLIMAFLWANAYHLLETMRTGSFHMPPSEEIFPTMVYFSVVTLTTLGYGDITPVTPSARVLVTLEAILGQIYVPVVVGYLLSLHISRKLSR